MEDVENDSRDLKAKRWTQEANRREQWTSVVKNANNHVAEEYVDKYQKKSLENVLEFRSNSRYSGGPQADGRHSIPSRGRRFFSPLQRPVRLWDPPRLLSNGYRVLFSRG
jgi:hypothetical protein